MKNYLVSFVGKPIGSLGIDQRFRIIVGIDDEEDIEGAILEELYKGYEHIHLGSLKVKPTKGKVK